MTQWMKGRPVIRFVSSTSEMAISAVPAGMPLHEIDGAALLPSQVYRMSIAPPSAHGVKTCIAPA